MTSRLSWLNPFSRRRKAAGSIGARAVEQLEDRVLMSAAPQITSVVADNRGKVSLTVNADLNAATVNTSSCVMFTAGLDGVLGTPDDVKLAPTVRYDTALRQINIKSSLTAATPYRVNIKGSLVTGSDATLLDGEFNGANVPSGDGVPGGNYKMMTQVAANKVARFTTAYGSINVRLFNEQTPITVRNFLKYANSGAWDGTFFHRSVSTATAGVNVIQGGAFRIADSTLDVIPTRDPITNEPGISDLRGTIAMAKTSDPNSATDQWFFNTTNNTALDAQTPQNSGGFTVFGQIANPAGLTAMDAIFALPVFNASAQLGSNTFSDLPVNQLPESGQGVGANSLVYVSRVAIKMEVVAMPPA